MKKDALARLLLAGSLIMGCAVTRADPPAPAPKGMPVQTAPARNAPVEDAGEYIAMMDSRRAIDLLPQVDGRVTRIFVTSGVEVAAGAPVVEIDPREQQATVAGAEEQRRAAESSLDYARKQYERTKSLFEHQTVSQQDFDQARTNYETARANLAAQQSRVNAERVTLRYFTVTAPFDGVIGDVRARVGDRVTAQTALTTIDQIRRLQVYVYVPGEQGARLKLGLPVRIVDSAGKVIDVGQVDFVSPRVERDTQTVLVKSTIGNESGALRQAESVRARIVFATENRIVIPTTAVTRLGGQPFVYVAEPQGGGHVARRRPIDVGAISGNDYVVLRGVAPGELVILTGTQKLADGAPVQVRS